MAPSATAPLGTRFLNKRDILHQKNEFLAGSLKNCPCPSDANTEYPARKFVHKRSNHLVPHQVFLQQELLSVEIVIILEDLVLVPHDDSYLNILSLK
jgi:hypothetical protein